MGCRAGGSGVGAPVARVCAGVAPSTGGPEEEGEAAAQRGDLDADFEARAAVGEHVAEVGLEAVVGARFDGDADALGVALL